MSSLRPIFAKKKSSYNYEKQSIPETLQNIVLGNVLLCRPLCLGKPTAPRTHPVG